MRRFWILGAALACAGCIYTQEMPLAPNVMRIDTKSIGAFDAIIFPLFHGTLIAV